MLIDKLAVDLVQHLMWPLVALIALFSLKKHIVELAKAAVAIKDLLGKGGELISLTERMGDVKKEAADIKQMLEAINIKDKGRELQALTENEPLETNSKQIEIAQLSVDEMFEKIANSWAGVQEVIRRKATTVGVRPNFMGTKGVSSTVGQILEKGGITARAATLAEAVSSQWQWIYRTSSPREEWLTDQVFRSFIDAAEQAKIALERRVTTV